MIIKVMNKSNYKDKTQDNFEYSTWLKVTGNFVNLANDTKLL